jgi:hypothetical protein
MSRFLRTNKEREAFKRESLHSVIIGSFLKKKLGMNAERQPSRDLYNPWKLVLEKANLSKDPLSTDAVKDTVGFLTKACWRAALPVDNMGSFSSYSVPATSRLISSKKKKKENDKKQEEEQKQSSPSFQVNRDKLKVLPSVKRNVPKVDHEELKKKKVRGPAIEVYKKLRQTALAAERLIDEKLLGLEEEVVEDDAEGEEGEDGGAPSDGNSSSSRKRKERVPSTSQSLILSTIDSQAEQQLSSSGEGSITAKDDASALLMAARKTGTTELLLLRCFLASNDQEYLMDSSPDVRQRVLKTQMVVPKKKVSGSSKSKEGEEEEEDADAGITIMFNCLDELKLQAGGAANANANSTAFYARRLENTLRYFTARQLHLLGEEYNLLAAAEDFHAKLSYLAADCAAMLIDTVDSMQFLLTKFGCDRWPEGERGPLNRNMGPLVQKMNTEAGDDVDLVPMHELVKVEKPCLWEYTVDKKDIGKKTEHEAEILWRRNIARRDPFTKMIFNCLDKSNPSAPKRHILRCALDVDAYQRDVHTIRKVISTVLRLRTPIMEKDREGTNHSRHEEPDVSSMSCVCMCICVFYGVSLVCLPLHHHNTH